MREGHLQSIKTKTKHATALNASKKKEDWSYRGAAGEGGSFSENDQWWNSEQKHDTIGTTHGKNDIRMESLKSIKSKGISVFSVSEDHIILGFPHEKIIFLKNNICARKEILKSPLFLLGAPKSMSYQGQHYAELLQWDPCFDLAAVLTGPLL